MDSDTAWRRLQGDLGTRVAWAALVLATMASPVYLWQSGVPQVSHVLLAVGIAVTAWHFRARYAATPLAAAIAFGAYTAVVNLVVYAAYGSPTSLRAPMHYAFGVGAFAFVAVLLRSSHRPTAFRLVFWLHSWVLVAMIAIPLAGFGRNLGDGVRVFGFFNDPNQFAHAALWSAVIVAVSGRVAYRSWLESAPALALAVAAVALSTSRSGLLGVGALAIALVTVAIADAVRSSGSHGFRLTRATAKRWAVVALASALTVTALGSLRPGDASSPIDRVSDTAQAVGSRLSSGAATVADRFEPVASAVESGVTQSWRYQVAVRGLDRLILYPSYAVFGTGEGANQRFTTGTRAHEVHSTWIGLVTNYGLVGAALFAAFVLVWWRMARHRLWWLPLIGPAAYGLTTYGLRNWLFWMGLAVVLTAAESGPDADAAPRGAEASGGGRAF